jgi:hypothetical protein
VKEWSWANKGMSVQYFNGLPKKDERDQNKEKERKKKKEWERDNIKTKRKKGNWKYKLLSYSVMYVWVHSMNFSLWVPKLNGNTSGMRNYSGPLGFRYKQVLLYLPLCSRFWSHSFTRLIVFLVFLGEWLRKLSHILQLRLHCVYASCTPSTS